MAAVKRRGLHTRTGTFYFSLVTVVCLTAVGLAVLDWPKQAFFFWIALGTYAIALPGYIAARVRWAHWKVYHAVGMASSYVAVVTAVIVNNINKLTGLQLPFAIRMLVPMFLGTCATGWLGYEVARGKRPRVTDRFAPDQEAPLDVTAAT